MWQAIKSVLAAFFGVQKDSQRRQDFEHGKPATFIIIAVVMALIMVVAVILIAMMAAG